MNTIRLQRTFVGEPREYFEFIINDIPLPKYFTEIYENWKNAEPVIPDNLIGVLNPFHSIEEQTVRIKAFLREEITTEECRRYFPHTQDWSVSEMTTLLKDDLNNEEVMLYCCSDCSDRNCAVITVKVKREDHCFTWTFDDKHLIEFRFEEKQYLEVFRSYLNEIKKAN